MTQDRLPLAVTVAVLLSLVQLVEGAHAEPLVVDDFSQHGSGYPAVVNYPYTFSKLDETGLTDVLGGGREMTVFSKTTVDFNPQKDHVAADIISADGHNALSVTATSGALPFLTLDYGAPVPEQDLKRDLSGTTAVRLVFSAINSPGNKTIGYTIKFDQDAGSTPGHVNLRGVVPTMLGEIASNGPLTVDIPLPSPPYVGQAGLADVDVFSVYLYPRAEGASFQLDRIELLPEPSILLPALLLLIRPKRRVA